MAKSKKTSKIKQNYTKTPKIWSLKPKQKLFLEAYIKHGGHITETCEDVGIHRLTYYSWIKIPEFQKALEDTEERFNDSIKRKILTMALNGEKDLLKFWAERKMKHMGFGEKKEIEVTTIQNTLTKEQWDEKIKQMLS